MANIKVELNQEIIDGQPVTIVAPCDCTAITGLKVYHPGGSKQFAFKDAHGNDLTGIGNLFTKGAIVKALLDVKNGVAYLQNADTNAYIENTFLKKSGGTMTGAINMGSKKITSLATPTADADASTKKYVDDGLGKKQDAFTTLPLDQGGTGATTAKGASAKILGDMNETEAAVSDDSNIVFKYSSPQTSTGAIFFKKASLLFDYIKKKLSLSDFGVTASATELNKLDGVTASTTELNYVDGVTSAIQTQLNNKASKFTLVWTNSKPESAFAAQTISKTLSSYDFIFVLYRAYCTSASYTCAFYKVGAGGQLETVTSGGRYRGITVTTTSVVFGEVYDSANVKSTNDYLVPYQIYGCKLT